MFKEKVWEYLSFKKTKGEKPSFNLRMMHGINKISIFMFLFAIIVMFVRFCK
jgi:hypothetical protein